ncbi:DUF4479 domain-containing protein [Ornithinibacillus gellani]|uniref:YtpR family tRNA-binding protein n=1 Tax=Ornithinibacillus gellani TaxID=2293253 RepID=UPI000F49A26F|nr:DUF4479 family protein [Ornithinibacillus gellani]TQS75431.1 DUF4479 domain-containing protein [Ornithinibacillus gellani]
MDVFYNANGVGDVLLVPLAEGDREQVKVETFGPVAKMSSATDGKVLGYNIFDASKYVDVAGNGKITLTEPMLTQIKQVFEDNQLNDALDFDLSPKFVVGYVLEKSPHENADKLSVCQVDVGEEAPLQIVCGAPNIDAGQKVVVAKIGAVMPSGLRIKPSTLRGVPSNGMICSQKELNLPNAPEEKGIYVLEESFTVGQAFEF